MSAIRIGAVHIARDAEKTNAIYRILRETISEINGARFLRSTYRPNRDILFVVQGPESFFQLLALNLPTRKGITLVRADMTQLTIIKGRVRPILDDIGTLEEYRKFETRLNTLVGAILNNESQHD